MGFRPLGSCKPPSLMGLKNHNHNLVRHHSPHFYHYDRRASPSDHHHRIFHSDSQQKTTQCQFPGLVWSGKGFHLGYDHYGAVKIHGEMEGSIFLQSHFFEEAKAGLWRGSGSGSGALKSVSMSAPAHRSPCSLSV